MTGSTDPDDPTAVPGPAPEPAGHGKAAVAGGDESAAAAAHGTHSVDGVRDELRRLGYLDHRVERFLLQDALRPQRPMTVLAHLAGKVCALIGAPAALGIALVVAATNGHVEHSPFDLLPLFLHLLVPVAMVLAVGFLTLAGLLVVLLRWRHARRIEGMSFGLSMMASVICVAFALWQGYVFLPALPTWQVVAALVALPFMAWAILEVVHGGLLTLAIRLTDLAPEKPSSHGRWIVLGLVLASFLGMVPAVLDAGHGGRRTSPSLPQTENGQVLVIGVDGVLAAEFDFLLAAGELPAFGELLDDGGVVVPYRRSAELDPPAFWTTVATGVPAPVHGMESLDSFRPLGMSRPLRRIGLLRRYWALQADLGLAEYRPVLASHRHAWAFWELAARGGGGAVVVDWWGTFPATALTGEVVAHGAYQLLKDADDPDAAGATAVHPPELAARLLPLVRRPADGVPAGLHRGLERVLPAAVAREVVDKALYPDVFYSAAFRDALERHPGVRSAVLYLPALDVAAGLAHPGSVAQAELVRWQLGRTDRLLASVAGAAETVLLIFDPGRRATDRGTLGGRALLWRRGGCADPREHEATVDPLTPAALGSVLLRAVGLPQSRQVPEPPVCSWPAPSITVDTYGARRPEEPRAVGDEYLEQLRSLGYL